MNQHQKTWLFFFVFLVGFLATDAVVSHRLQWDGVFRLVQRVEAPGDQAPAAPGGAAADAPRVADAPPPAAASVATKPRVIQAQGIYLLVTLAVGMYVFASWALARAWVTAGSRPDALTRDELKAIGAPLAAIDPAGPADTPDALVTKPLTDHARVWGSLSATTSTPVRAILGRLGPRDLLGHGALEQALLGGVAARWRTSLGEAEAIDGLGQICAVAGLGSTVAGLIVAGTGHTEHALLALSGALLKCMVGMFARLGCLAASHLVREGARAEEQDVLDAPARAR